MLMTRFGTMMTRIGIVFMSVMMVLTACLVVNAWNTPDPMEREQKVKTPEVPKAALAALKKLAGEAKIDALGAEIEHGQTLYEGAWKGPYGRVEAEVTAEGDLVEMGEIVTVESAPKAVQTVVERVAGKGTRLTCEKKTVILYEVEFSKGDRHHELVLSPDGHLHENQAAEDSNDGDESNDEAGQDDSSDEGDEDDSSDDV